MASPQGEQHAPGSSNNTSTFHNLDPRTREERLAAQSREKLEKNLLKARRGCFHKYEEAGNPIVPEPKSPMYSDEADRFKRDVAGEMRQQKVEAWKRQQVRCMVLCHYMHARSCMWSLPKPCRTHFLCFGMPSLCSMCMRLHLVLLRVVHTLPQLCRSVESGKCTTLPLNGSYPQETYNRKRGEQMEKEEQRWEKMAEAQALEAARMEAVRAAGIRGKQNQSSEHFNIITLNYHDTPQGHTLQYKVRELAAGLQRAARGACTRRWPHDPLGW